MFFVYFSKTATCGDWEIQKKRIKRRTGKGGRVGLVIGGQTTKMAGSEGYTKACAEIEERLSKLRLRVCCKMGQDGLDPKAFDNSPCEVEILWDFVTADKSTTGFARCYGVCNGAVFAFRFLKKWTEVAIPGLFLDWKGVRATWGVQGRPEDFSLILGNKIIQSWLSFREEKLVSLSGFVVLDAIVNSPDSFVCVSCSETFQLSAELRPACLHDFCPACILLEKSEEVGCSCSSYSLRRLGYNLGSRKPVPKVKASDFKRNRSAPETKFGEPFLGLPRSEKPNGKGECAVCMEVYTDAFVSTCGHTACRGCWEGSGTLGGGLFKCPTCRAAVDSRHMIRNYDI